MVRPRENCCPSLLLARASAIKHRSCGEDSRACNTPTISSLNFTSSSVHLASSFSPPPSLSLSLSPPSYTRTQSHSHSACVSVSPLHPFLPFLRTAPQITCSERCVCHIKHLRIKGTATCSRTRTVCRWCTTATPSAGIGTSGQGRCGGPDVEQLSAGISCQQK